MLIYDRGKLVYLHSPVFLKSIFSSVILYVVNILYYGREDEWI